MKNQIQYIALALLIVLSASSFSVKAQNTPKKLTGTMIFKQGADCDSENTLAKAFDGNLQTYYHSCGGITSGNWVGLDLGKKHVITAVSYAPRIQNNDYVERLQLGIFEGANEADFSDAIPFFIIPNITLERLITREVNSSRGFRYVRFIFPVSQEGGKSSYISELGFYGYEGDGNDSSLPQLTNLPTISIRTVNGQGIEDKVNYVKGVITIVYDNGTKIFTDSLEIRGRGNNSWTHPKKPYRIKLANSTRLMGLPAKARNWTLINNYGDKTLMRNMVAFDFSKRLEMPYTSPASPVDVVLNGDYKGCYQLCDHIDVRKNRVDIEEMNPTDLTGGYMVEIDAYAGSEPKMFVSSNYGIPVTIKYPGDDEITLQQEQYIETHFNKFAASVAGNNFANPQTGFRKYLDIETFLRHFMVGEYAGNTDTYWSVRMTKKRNDDKFYFGPVWDYDLGFENDHRTYPVNDKDEWICFYTGGLNHNGEWQDGTSAAGNTRALIKRILSDEEASKRLTEIYSYYRDRNIISQEVLTQVVDSCEQLLEQSQNLNFKRWRIMNQRVHENPVIHGSYDAEVDNVRNYVSDRIAWMDRKLNYIPNPVPNPTPDSNNVVTDPAKVYAWTGKNTIYLNMAENNTVSITNLSGEVIRTEHLSSGSYHFTVNSGAYVISIVDQIGNKQNYKCIVP